MFIHLLTIVSLILVSCISLKSISVEEIFNYFRLYRPIGIVLHIDPWPSRQSEILCKGRTYENNRTQSRGRTEMWVLWNNYAQEILWSQSWRLNLLPENIGLVTENASEWQDALLGQRLTDQPTTEFRLSSHRPRSWRVTWRATWGLEDNTAWYGQEKK